MTKRALQCTIESAADGWMVIWFGRWKVEASCRITMEEGTIKLTGTVRSGPKKWRGREINITSADNENGKLRLAA